MKTYYLVGRNNTWTNDAVPASYFTDKGATVQPSRTDGDMQLFIDGRMMGWMFEKQSEQINFLRSKNLI